MIGIYPNRKQAAAQELARAVAKEAELLGEEARFFEEEDTAIRRADLVLSIGGDGTVLSSARLLAGTQVPLWAIHTGGLGFLTDCLPGEVLPRLPQVLAKKYNERILGTLDCVFSQDTRTVSENLAVNDCVVTSGGLGKMIRLAIRVDGALLSQLHADGVIVATAAGSTAYNLAAGGPILAAPTSAMVVTPICPHTLAQRPVVVTKAAVIEIEVLPSRTHPRLLADGKECAAEVPAGARIRIARGARTVTLVRTSDRSDFEILREKLGWGDPREMKPPLS